MKDGNFDKKKVSQVRLPWSTIRKRHPILAVADHSRFCTEIVCQVLNMSRNETSVLTKSCVVHV